MAKDPVRRGEPPFWRTLALGVYLFVAGSMSAGALIVMFPLVQVGEGAQSSIVSAALAPWLNREQWMILLAASAGGVGAFLHAAHSFITYVGNRRLRGAWFWFYVYRPPIGASLGIVFYFVVRAGFMSGSAGEMSPYGVVALGVLAGWFSKQATNKLAEVFDTLFRTAQQNEDRDQLTEQPREFKLESVQAEWGDERGDTVLAFTIKGSGFTDRLTMLLDDTPVETELTSPTSLRASLSFAEASHLRGQSVHVRVAQRQPPFQKTEAVEVDVPEVSA